MALGPEQQKALFRAKLTSLVRSHFSHAPVTGSPEDRFDPDAAGIESVGFANGATLIDGPRAIVLLDGSSAEDGIDGLLGHALITVRQCETVHLLVDAAAGSADDSARAAATVVRRASGIRTVASVWRVDGTDLAAFPSPRLSPPAADIPIDDPWVELMREEHLDVLVEDGAVVGELLGVEVARIVAGHDGVPRLDVGVGLYDQEAFAMMNAGLDVSDGLTKVCAEVRKYRAPGAEPHPINRLARERWLRALVLNNPAAVGLDRLSPVPSLRPRAGIKDEQPVVAIGTDPDGRLVGVVCAVGLDLDLVPTAADAVVTYGLEAITLVIPPRDHYPLVDELAALLTVETHVFEAEEPWPSATT